MYESHEIIESFEIRIGGSIIFIVSLDYNVTRITCKKYCPGAKDEISSLEFWKLFGPCQLKLNRLELAEILRSI